MFQQMERGFMAIYLVGDIQGCDSALARLLAKLDFSPSRDTLYVLGDMVNRGPDSAGTLRRLMGMGHSVQCVLGNHDLHLLAVSQGVRPAGRRDTLAALLEAPDAVHLMHWLRQQHLAISAHGILMVHAGVLPSWTAAQTLALADEVTHVLRSPEIGHFLQNLYGDTPNQWRDDLIGHDRLRMVINALTRLRFCSVEGQMEFETKDGAGPAPEGYMPWFDVPGRLTAKDTVAFGHWSTLGWLDRSNVIGLDTGCVWGGCLTALRLGDTPASHERIEVQCDKAQAP
jgi:bis(5'-nucleosyl)-tetraphosphatase (symmetrical)